MTIIVITAQVKDAVEWEKGYRAHAPLLREFLGVTRPIHFTTNTETNEICICVEPDNLEKYLGLVQSPEVIEAMEKNGVNRETVKLYILDKELKT
jgi:hypothetical protein